MKYLGIIILVSVILNSLNVRAQDEDIHFKNRICSGIGGEDGYLGIDYARDIYKSKIFLGIGYGLGTGWTGYLRYEPLRFYGLSPFISSGVSHSFGGTLIVSPRTSIFSASAGLNYLPKLKWVVLPSLGVGITYYYIIAGDEEGGMNGFGPLIKIGVAFPK